MFELAKLFLKLGFTAFGGPAAHIALMEQEVVTRRQWMTEEEFLDLIAVTNLIPGPNSTEMTMHVGRHQAGWPGMILAGTCFILPASLITGLLAWLYTQYGTLPQATPMLDGFKPAVLAIVAIVLYKFAKKTIKAPSNMAIFTLTVGLAFSGLNEALVILIAGIAGVISCNIKSGSASATIVPLISMGTAGPFLTHATDYAIWKLALVFLKTGSILFGSGYVLFAFLEPDLVTRYEWLTRQELLDAIAIGQFTPGPVLSASTFIGYQVDGWAGAATATICIFLPSFLVVAIATPLIPRLRKSKATSAFLDGAKTGSVGLILVVLIRMGIEILHGIGPAIITTAALAILIWKPKLNSFWVIVIGGVGGYFLL